MMGRKRKYQSDLKQYKISIKLSEKDMERLNHEIEVTNTTVSSYVRELIRTGGSVDTKFPEDRAKLIRQISGIATNINQIAKIANTQGHIYLSDIQEVKEELEQIKKLLREVTELWRLQKS